MLSLLKRNRPVDGLAGLELTAEGVALAHVIRVASRKPRVSSCDFRPWTDDRFKLIARMASDNGLKGVRATTLLSPDEYSVVLTEAPDVPAAELKSALRWRVKDLIDFHINDATLDVFDLPGESGRGRARPMFAVVARNEIIRERVELLTNAGITLDVIDIPELAQRNIAALVPEDQQGLAVLALSRDRGLLTVTRAAELYLTRSVDLGYEALAAGDAGATDRLVLEIQRSLDYVESNFRQAPVAHVAVAPLPVEAPDLIAHLNAGLNARAAWLDLAALLDWPSPPPPLLQHRCFNAIGAALREEEVAL